MHTLTTACHCGAVKLSLSLPEAPASYHPRRCDCDFCTQRSLSYISDPAGSLLVQSTAPLQRQQQGAQLADFISCAHCHSILCTAFITPAGACVGGANAALFASDTFAGPIDISPKQFSATEKAERWGRLWTPLEVIEEHSGSSFS